jgi:cell division protein FtsZ
MVETNIQGVQFWGINTDAQALTKAKAKNTLNIGRKVTRGLGAGGNPAVGKVREGPR